jgi:hypothetical protein
MADFLFESLAESLYYDMVNLTRQAVPPPFTTTSIDKLPGIRGKLKNHGWERGMPCVVDILGAGDMPTISITE